DAIMQLRVVLQARPSDPLVHQHLARAELKRGDLDAALTALRSAAALSPDTARIHFQIGEVLYQRGLSEDARAPLERAIELDPTLSDAYHLIAFVYGDIGDNDRAMEAQAKAAQL